MGIWRHELACLRWALQSSHEHRLIEIAVVAGGSVVSLAVALATKQPIRSLLFYAILGLAGGYLGLIFLYLLQAPSRLHAQVEVERDELRKHLEQGPSLLQIVTLAITEGESLLEIPLMKRRHELIDALAEDPVGIRQFRSGLVQWAEATHADLHRIGWGERFALNRLRRVQASANPDRRTMRAVFDEFMVCLHALEGEALERLLDSAGEGDAQ